ncbi:MAG TPA: DUF2461 domain-containing protein [Myxococcales bacterium]
MFEGIGPRAARLIAELAHRQDKAWYAAHKAEIEDEVYAPLRALFEEATPLVQRLYPRQEVTAKIFRIYRDVRFSRDKAPYKDHASGVLMVGPRKDPMRSAGALYLQIGPEEGAAAGMWSMEGDDLRRYRAAVLDAGRGAQLDKLLRPLLADGYTVISAAQLVRAPKGVDPAHPRAQLLRHKGLALDFPAIPRRVRQSRELLGWTVARAREVAPLVRWLLDVTA